MHVINPQRVDGAVVDSGNIQPRIFYRRQQACYRNIGFFRHSRLHFSEGRIKHLFSDWLSAKRCKFGTSDVALKNFNFWTGTVGLNAIISRDLTIFASASGFLPHTFRQVGKLPFSLGPFGFAPEIDFTGSNLECWTMQCGISLGNWGGGSFLLGSLWQYTSMRYDDMTIFGHPGNPTATQDFLLKNWAPFIGLQYMEAGIFRAAVIYSPFMTSSGSLDSRTIAPIMSDLSYNLNQPGYLVSVTGEYFLPMKPPASFSLWFIGAASSLKGSSDVGFVAGNISRTGVVSDLTLTQYSLGGGLNAAITF